MSPLRLITKIFIFLCTVAETMQLGCVYCADYFIPCRLLKIDWVKKIYIKKNCFMPLDYCTFIFFVNANFPYNIGYCYLLQY